MSLGELIGTAGWLAFVTGARDQAPMIFDDLPRVMQQRLKQAMDGGYMLFTRSEPDGGFAVIAQKRGEQSFAICRAYNLGEWGRIKTRVALAWKEMRAAREAENAAT
jgi:hypothetical protein